MRPATLVACAATAVAGFGAATGHAQTAAAVIGNEPMVVVGSRNPTPTLQLPAAVDLFSADAPALSQPGINASETLGGRPGLVANNRQNLAQDLQITLRGFGARATFGVRGVRILQDGIPQTMPDGQGQTGVLDLDSADHWEVLRGPLSVMYGNSAGGVIQLFSDFSRGDDHARLGASAGSGSTVRFTLAAKADAGDAVLAGNAAHMETSGFRDHSAATRDTQNLRAKWQITPAQELTFIANKLDQPNTQDPLGLTQAQVDANRLQAGTGALQFNTRKSIAHQQLGAAWSWKPSDQWTLKLTPYGGQRDIFQFLGQTGSAPTSSGGVVHLDRMFRGLGTQATLATGLVTATLGVDFDEQIEDRTGYVNNNGTAGALRRDERNHARNLDYWLQTQWALGADWQAIAGVRRSDVSFRVKDRYITASNPDDSGSRDYGSTSGVLGLSWRLQPGMAAYISAGRGFETPTLAEFAYRPDGKPGSNLQLNAATHRTVEIGAKGRWSSGDAQAALFSTRTDDEIVAGPQIFVGRSTFVNAARTRRDGVELAFSQQLVAPAWKASGSLSWLRARFDDFTGTTGANLNGKLLPGIAARNAYAELAWRPERTGPSAALEWRAASRVWVNDANAAFAPGYGVFNLRVRHVWLCAKQECAVFARIDNLAGRDYIGSVIVNAANAQYFEPAPGRQFLAGFNVRFGRD